MSYDIWVKDGDLFIERNDGRKAIIAHAPAKEVRQAIDDVQMGWSSEEKLADAMRKLLDGTWRLRAKEIDTEIDRVTFYEITQGEWRVASGYDDLPGILKKAMEAEFPRSEDPRPLHK